MQQKDRKKKGRKDGIKERANTRGGKERQRERRSYKKKKGKNASTKERSDKNCLITWRNSKPVGKIAPWIKLLQNESLTAAV